MLCYSVDSFYDSRRFITSHISPPVDPAKLDKHSSQSQILLPYDLSRYSLYAHFQSPWSSSLRFSDKDYSHLFHTCYVPTYLILVDLITLTCGEECNYKAPHYVIFCPPITSFSLLNEYRIHKIGIYLLFYA